MKRGFLFSFLILSMVAFISRAQQNVPNDTIYNFVDVQPEFPGGNNAYFKFLQDSLKYPEDAKRNRVEGKVVTLFVINQDGSISDIKIVKGLESGCDAEAIRLIRSMPKFSPAMKNRKPVRCYYKLPITFKR